jgi:hypothetical protein
VTDTMETTKTKPDQETKLPVAQDEYVRAKELGRKIVSALHGEENGPVILALMHIAAFILTDPTEEWRSESHNCEYLESVIDMLRANFESNLSRQGERRH